MKRRELLKTTAAGGGVLLAPSLARAATDFNKKPNILFIMTDQQHDRMMSCADNEWLSTPHLDGLAAEGVRFANAYATNPVCVPSRMSMATGMMPGRLGAGENKSGMRAELAPHIDENSMGKIMKRAGYDTFYGGKVHMCGQLKPDSDHGAGYDTYYKDQRGLLPRACLEFIQKDRVNTFFAVASFINPHDICYAHKAHIGSKSPVKNLYEEAMALQLDELPPLPDNYGIQDGEPSGVRNKLSSTAVTPSMTMRDEYDERAWRVNRYIYNRLTERVDGEIGEILDGLKQAGLEENTLVIFTSDHGNMDGSHRLASKSFHFEESVGVPFIMKFKGDIPSGQVDGDHLVSTGIDILPTICDYAGAEIPEHLIGKSLRPLAEGKPVDSWREYVVSEDAEWRMLRTGNFKYTTFADPTSKESLVDLNRDPGEMRNLVDNPEYKDIMRDHRKLLAEWCASTGDTEAFKFARNDDGKSDYTPSPEVEVPETKGGKRKNKSKKGNA